MPTLLILATDDVADLFVNEVSEEFEVVRLEPGATEDTARVRQISSIEELESPPDAVFILANRDDGDVESSLALLTQEQLSDVPHFVSTHFTTATNLHRIVPEVRAMIGFGWIPRISGDLWEVAPSMQSDDQAAARAIDLLGAVGGKEVEVMEDRVALSVARTLSMIVNEAAFTIMEGVASAEDIDMAMKLGTGYPKGPLEWADLAGADFFVDVLDALQEEYGEERYRPCVLLRQYGRAERSFTSSSS